MDRDKHLAKIDKLISWLLRYTSGGLWQTIPTLDLLRIRKLERLVLRHKERFHDEVRNPNAFKILTNLCFVKGDFKTVIEYRKKAINLQRAVLAEDCLITAEGLHRRYASIDSKAEQIEHPLLKEALEYAEKAVIGARNLPDYALLAKALNRRGMIYANIGRFDLAMSDFRESRNLAENNDLLIELAHALNNIGGVHSMNNEDDMASLHYKKALDIDKKVKYYVGIERDFYGLGHLIEEHTPKDALEYFKKCLKLIKHHIYDLKAEANIYASLARSYKRISKKKLAQKFEQKEWELRTYLKRINL